MLPKRQLLIALLSAGALVASGWPTIAASDNTAWNGLQAGAIVLFRHANAPGGGDPPGMRIGDCATQRNLDQAGREQAKRIGAAFQMRAIAISEVLTSQWCRTMETARLAFGDSPRQEPVFNSFFEDRDKGPEQTRQALALLSRKAGNGSTIIITHQVNITAITGIFPASGEGIVIRIVNGQVLVLGRIRP